MRTLAGFCVFVLVLGWVSLTPGPAETAAVSDTLVIAKDADIILELKTGADSSYTGNTSVIYMGAYAGTQYSGIVQIDKTKLRSNRAVNNARLQFVNASVKQAISSTNFIGAWLVDKDWTETTVTGSRRSATSWWNTYGLGATMPNFVKYVTGEASYWTVAYSDTAAVLPATVDRPYMPAALFSADDDTLQAQQVINFDVTSEISKFVNGDRTGSLGFLVAFYDTTTVTALLSFGSRTNATAANRPRLIVDYGDSTGATAAPTTTTSGVGWPDQFGVSN